MKIQLINYSGDNVSSLEVEECNSFGNAVSLDSFDLNIIDLSDQLLWRNTNCKDNYHKYIMKHIHMLKSFNKLLLTID